MMNEKSRRFLLLLIFIGGFVSLSLEITVLRQLSGFVGSTAIVTSIIIGIFLAFMSWGYYAGAQQPIAFYAIRRQVAKYFLLIALIVILAASYVLMDIYFMAMAQIGIRSHVWQTFVYALLFLSAGPFGFGKITALLSRYLHHQNPNYTGKVMAVDTIGSFLGSLVGTLIIMPLWGVNYTIMVMVFLAVVAAVMLAKKQNFPAIMMLLSAAYLFNSPKLLNDLYGIVTNNAASTVAIVETDEGKSKLFILNGAINSKVSKDPDLRLDYVKFVEDNFISKLPQSGEPKKILILGAGGFTMGLEDSHNDYVFVDIDSSLKQIAEDKFLPSPLTANKKFVVQDANQFLKEDEQHYDLIIVDAYSFLTTIPQDLITKEFFERVKSRLKLEGVVLMNIISNPNFSNAFSRSIDNTLRQVFAHNLQRQVIGSYNGWAKDEKRNVVYVYYNYPNLGKIYTHNKNGYFYDM